MHKVYIKLLIQLFDLFTSTQHNGNTLHRTYYMEILYLNELQSALYKVYTGRAATH